MSARPQQGSASFTIVIAGLAALVIGALLLTTMFYPIFNTFTDAAFWSSDSVAGSRVVTYTQGLWAMWGLVILIAITAFIWVETRQ